MTFTVEQLAAATSAPYGNAQTYHQPLLDAMGRFDICSLQRQAAFLATVLQGRLTVGAHLPPRVQEHG